ncbi:hypothetical protein M413DRAFT_109886 [Hebeloma cylindrosporum]|uniref:Lipoyl-binding domain-containing protein n=1 Tax=Hebeloma cylindrosporum TaxID=76867 RepID=A0A0C2YIB7_HEBCY|nr:hypothetical protein M413DRAFT_109886 [Hebeloma cylindrosporum h7]
MALTRVPSAVCRTAQLVSAKRLLHGSASRRAITNFQMPAMSPTMTEGGIASWKKKEGESFLQGDVLLEIETDKATIDVEAQDDGIMGKILAPDGTKGIPVGKIIALLAEEGDDISNLQPPKDEPAPTPPPKQAEAPAPTSASSSAPTPNDAQCSQSHAHSPPAHSRPLFPSVHRLLLENGITKPDDIKATGVRGMLTKGDVLAFLGKASGPLGTFKPSISPIAEATQASAKKAPEPKKAPLDGAAIRQLIVSSMLQASIKARNPIPASIKNADFDSVLADYLPPSPKPSQTSNSAPLTAPKRSESYLDGLH